MSEPTEREWLEGLRYEDKFPEAGDGGRVPDVSEQRAETVEEWRAGDPTPNDLRTAELVQLAQDRQIEINVWRSRYEEAEAQLSEVASSDPASVLAALLAESPEATVAAIEALLTSDEARETYWDSHDVLRYADTHEKVPGKPWDRRASGHVRSACRSLLPKAPKEDDERRH
jgi:hypothetical protein